MGEFLEQMSTVWPLVTQAPQAFIALGVALLLAGWAFGRFAFGERIANLRERLDAYKEKLDGASPEEVRKQISELKQRLDEAMHDPRLLRGDQLEKMAAVLRQHKSGSIIVSRAGSTLQCGGVQTQVRRFFTQQGWTVQHWETMDNPNTPTGVALFTHTGDEVSDDERAVRSALEAASIAYEVQRQTPNANGEPQLVFNDID